jgi:serine phosphatase RsbU (regulator of sigma subunit)
MPSSTAAGKKSPTSSDRQHPEALIDEIVRIVQNFAGEIPQEDDINCVALRVEEVC